MEKSSFWFLFENEQFCFLRDQNECLRYKLGDLIKSAH